MAKLLEVKYEDIFSPETIASLKGKSGQSLRDMLGNKNLMSALGDTQKLLDNVIEAESDYHIELPMIAEIMAREAYPILDYSNIKIDAKIVKDQAGLELPSPSENEEPVDAADVPMASKRRIINGITQGAAVRGAFAFLLFKEHLDDLNPALVEKYNEMMKLVFGIYDDEDAIAMMLAMLAQGQKQGGGSSEMTYDVENEQFVIKARALCFPMLLHEIIKGLYEIVGTEGFGLDSEKNKEIIDKVDTLQNEPEDFRYGKFIYDAISNLYNESGINDARIREIFFTEVYKLEDNEFFPFIDNVINNKLTPAQKKWAIDTMKDIESDLAKDDTGLKDLGE